MYIQLCKHIHICMYVYIHIYTYTYMDKCPNELLKTMSDEEFLIVQAWVNEILTLPEKTIDTRAPESVHHEWHHLSTPQRRQHQQNV